MGADKKMPDKFYDWLNECPYCEGLKY